MAPDARVLAHCYWHRDRTARATILGLHGLEGSSQAHYMQGLADKAWAAGFNVVLLNQRNCGGTEHLSSTLYHSGLTADADWVLRELAAEGLDRFGVVGYSLGRQPRVEAGRRLRRRRRRRSSRRWSRCRR